MTTRNPLVCLLLALCLMLGAVGEAVARGEMALMSDLVLCGADGQTTVTLDANGKPTQRHPCTHCLAAGAMALPQPAQAAKPPALLRAVPLVQTAAVWHLRASVLAPSARGPPVSRI